MRLVLLCLIISISMTTRVANATLSLPSGLTAGEQELILQIMGFGTSFRPVDNPYPLGGYSGLELGVSFENIPTGDIGYFGSKATVDRNLIFPRISLGKGIFNSVDLLLSFVPYNENTGLSIYSGGLRWVFFQATFVPACFSLLFSGSNTNLNDLFISQTEGVDLISAVNVDMFSFYVGAGTLYGQGQFYPAITSDSTKSNRVGRSFHTMIGVNFSLDQLFSALEVDTYNTTTVSMKIGARL